MSSSLSSECVDNVALVEPAAAARRHLLALQTLEIGDVEDDHG